MIRALALKNFPKKFLPVHGVFNFPAAQSPKKKTNWNSLNTKDAQMTKQIEADIDEYGTFFNDIDDPLKPDECILDFVKDMKRRKFMDRFQGLEDGELVEDKEFLAWLHPDFTRDYMTYCVTSERWMVNMRNP
mgnify:CR=1 FL=1|tara:strand:- start:462 stop:860 length:399 start_codon:yes stop_codon:yes gene_type:complete